jgi:sialate O-acetylesterase
MRRAVLAFFCAALACADPKLPALFGDHMVLEHGRPIPVWGWAEEGEPIRVTLGSAAASTTAGPDGRWRVDLPAQKPGGPLIFTVVGHTTLRFRDVLIGEVWMASGQSNMAFGLSGAATSSEDLPKAGDDGMRLLTVPKATSLQPRDRFPARWQASTPDTAREFSAVAWYFGRERRRLGIPVGLIHTSWPGTQAEEWTDAKSLAADPDFAPILERWNAVAAQTYGLEEKPLDFELVFDGLSLAGRRPAPLPARWKYSSDSAPDTALEVSAGARLWGRLRAADSSQLSLSFTPDGAPADLRAFSGIRFRVHGHGFFKVHLLQPTITDWDNYATPVLEATAEPREIVVEFAGLKQAGWGVRRGFTPEALTSFVIEPQLGRTAERPPSGLFQAMIAPLAPYGIHGAIWYQGEGNAGRAFQYRKLLPAMIQGWRAAWGYDFPFLIVQLPNFRERRLQPSESDWAELREAQSMALRLPNTGLAVTIDLGEADNVHPANKRAVGERLARAAAGESSPLYAGLAVEGPRIRIRFRDGDGLAALGGGPLRGFAIAGEDRRFVWAKAAIEGETVVVWSPEVPKPVAVRYAWADNPDCNLGNRAGLPASPFRSDR